MSASPTTRLRHRPGADRRQSRSRGFRRDRRHRHDGAERLRARRRDRGWSRIAASVAAPTPLIYLSRDADADYRIFVRSKTFTARDAAALVVGAGGTAAPVTPQRSAGGS